MSRVIVVGATSAIAQEAARMFAQDGASMFLVARDREKLAAVADDLRVRGATRVETSVINLLEWERHEELVESAAKALGGLDLALIAHGNLSDQAACESRVAEIVREMNLNCLSVISLATVLGNYFERQSYGCVAVIASVAGDRGRRSNYVYGTAKGAVDIFLQGLRSRLFPQGVAVVTIKPGLVDTPMTAALPKNCLFASARTVGLGVYRAMLKRKNVVYLPWFWRWIMAIVRILPEALFKRLNV
jgi:short-subunit dehydrogenase